MAQHGTSNYKLKPDQNGFSTYLKFLRKRTFIFSYFLQICNRISALTMSMLFVLDFVLILPITFESILRFSNDGTSNYNSYNYFNLLDSLGIGLYISDAMSAYLICFFIVISIYFMKYDFDIKTLRDKNKNFSISCISFLLLLTGRYLFNFIIAFQVMSIKCSIKSDKINCFSYITSKGELYFNIIGIIFNILISYIQFEWQDLSLPKSNVPWANGNSNYKIIKRTIVLICVLEMALIDVLISSLSFYVLLIPLLIFDSYDLFFLLLIQFLIGKKAHLYSCQDEKCPCLSVMQFFIRRDGANEIRRKIPYFNFNDAFLELLEKFSIIEQGKIQSQENLPEEETQENQFGKIQKVSHDKSELFQRYQFDKNLRYQNNLNYSNKEEIDFFLYEVDKRNDLIQKIIFSMFKNQNYGIKIQILEVFVKVDVYSRLFQGLFQLQEMKKQMKSSTQNQKYYSFLNFLIIQKSQSKEINTRRDEFNIDRILIVDKHFQDYKRISSELTLMVERFWRDLQKQDYEVKQIISLGKGIVQSYLIVQHLYDQILEEKPDFREIIVLSIALNQNVLNFEIEALQQNALLKNIDQKSKIIQQNTYDLDQWKHNSGIIIMSLSPSMRNKILFVNKLALSLTKYNLRDVLHKQITMLMPSIIGQAHDGIIEKYLCSDRNNQRADLRRVWVLNSEGHIIPVKIQIETYISEKEGLLMVAFIEPVIQIKKKNMQSKTDDSYFLLTDDQGYIIQSSENFVKDFLGQNQYVQDTKINIDEMFMNMHTYSDKEMKSGIKTRLHMNFLNNRSQGFSCHELDDLYGGSVLLREISLVQTKYRLLGNVDFKEIIFTIDRVAIANFSHNQLLNSDFLEEERSNDGVIFDERFIAHQDLMYGGQSESSASSDSFKSGELLQIKQIIDFQTTPQSIVNVRRALIMFFMTLAATSFAVLAVSLISNKQFTSDYEAVKNSIYLVGQLANLRLTFRMILENSYLPPGDMEYSYNQLQGMMNKYYSEVQYYYQQLIQDTYSPNSPLNYYMGQNALQLAELQIDGSISTYNTTFTTGIQQYLSKVDTFMEMNQTTFQSLFTHFTFYGQGIANQSLNYRNVWFIIQNQNHEIRNFCLLIQSLYIEEGMNKVETYTNTVLIIAVSCIGVTILISLIFLPVTFALDNEEKEIISYWTLIQQETIGEVLKQINEYSKIVFNENLDKPKIETAIENDQKFLDDQTMFDHSHSLIISNQNLRGKDNLQRFTEDHLGQFLEINDNYSSIKNQIEKQQDWRGKTIVTIDQKSPTNKKSSNMNILESISEHQINQEQEDNQSRQFSYQLENKTQSANNPPHQNFVNNYDSDDLHQIKNIKIQHKTVSFLQNKDLQTQINYHEQKITNKESLSSYGFTTIQELHHAYFKRKNKPIKKEESNSDLSRSDLKRDINVQEGDSPRNLYAIDNQNNIKNINQAFHSFGTNPNIYNTTLDNTVLNQTAEDAMIKKETYKQEQNRQLQQIFQKEKLKKAGIILSFSSIIIGFYLLSYFLCGNIFSQSSDSFTYQQTASRRGPCLTTSFNIIIETVNQNQSQEMGTNSESLEQYVRDDCSGFEVQYLSYIKSPPPQLASISDQLATLESSNACIDSFQNDSSMIQQCDTYMNSMLSKGLRSTFQNAYFYILNFLVNFESKLPSSRTQSFLNSLEQDTTLHQYFKLTLDYIIPITDQVRQIIDDSISSYLNSKVNQYVIIFSIFIVFLAVSLVIALKYVIEILKRVVFRSRILIKIIPTDELKRINNIIKERKQRE